MRPPALDGSTHPSPNHLHAGAECDGEDLRHPAEPLRKDGRDVSAVIEREVDDARQGDERDVAHATDTPRERGSEPPMTEGAIPLERAAQQLRRRAEALPRDRAVREPHGRAPRSPEEVQRTLEELHLHQIELEMQNEELQRAKAELEAARERYFELYELAPVGYCTVTDEGVFIEGNLMLASLLGTARVASGRRRLQQLIAATDQDIYYQHRRQLLETRAPQAGTCRRNSMGPGTGARLVMR